MNNDVVPKSAAEPDALPDQFPGFLVLSVLGEGGMGKVYKAVDVHMNRVVAIKTLASGASVDEQTILRFRQEARAVSSLQHPNIITVFEFGIAEGIAFLVMEYLDGITLEDVIVGQDGRMDLKRFQKIFLQVCKGMHHAHKRGLIHRDLKPSNIMLLNTEEESDLVKILDFGLAKGSETEPSQHLTRTGVVLGSPPFMSPEQCKGESLDHRTDIYSLGCVMFAALTGEVPFMGPNTMATLYKHISDDPRSICDVAPDLKIPPELERTVMQCLGKDRAARPQTMLELHNRIQAAIENSHSPGSTPSVSLTASPVAASDSISKSPDEASEARSLKAPTIVSGRSAPADQHYAQSTLSAASILSSASDGPGRKNQDTMSGAARAQVRLARSLAGAKLRNAAAVAALVITTVCCGLLIYVRPAPEPPMVAIQSMAIDKTEQHSHIRQSSTSNDPSSGASASPALPVNSAGFVHQVKSENPSVDRQVVAQPPSSIKGSQSMPPDSEQHIRTENPSTSRQDNGSHSASSARSTDTQTAAAHSATSAPKVNPDIQAKAVSGFASVSSIHPASSSVKLTSSAARRSEALARARQLQAQALRAFASRDYSSSRTLAQQELTLEQEIYGPQHPSLVPTLANIIACDLQENKLSASSPYFEQLFKIFSKDKSAAAKVVSETTAPHRLWKGLAMACLEKSKQAASDMVRKRYAQWSVIFFDYTFQTWGNRPPAEYVWYRHHYLTAAIRSGNTELAARLRNELVRQGQNRLEQFRTTRTESPEHPRASTVGEGIRRLRMRGRQ